MAREWRTKNFAAGPLTYIVADPTKLAIKPNKTGGGYSLVYYYNEKYIAGPYETMATAKVAYMIAASTGIY